MVARFALRVVRLSVLNICYCYCLVARQAGRGHSDAPDAFVYVHFPAAAEPATSYWDGNEYLLVGRVPRTALLNRSAYQFWDGTAWQQQHDFFGDTPARQALAAAAVLSYPFMLGQDHSHYSPQLQRYLLPNYGFVAWETGQPVGWHGYYQEHHRAPAGQLTLYEAPEPQGPWALVGVTQPWNLAGNGAFESEEVINH